jgi:hypothetical protein
LFGAEVSTEMQIFERKKAVLVEAAAQDFRSVYGEPNVIFATGMCRAIIQRRRRGTV